MSEAAKADFRLDFEFTDQDETWTVWVQRGVMNARRGASPDAQLTVSGPKAALIGVALQPAAAGKLADAGKLSLTGDRAVLDSLAAVLDDFERDFNIVVP